MRTKSFEYLMAAIGLVLLGSLSAQAREPIQSQPSPTNCVGPAKPSGGGETACGPFETDRLRFSLPNGQSISLARKLQSTVDPIECGALNDGKADDAAAIAECASRASSTGRELVLSGIYRVSNVRLAGTGHSPLSIRSSATFVGTQNGGGASLLELGGSVRLSGRLRIRCLNNPSYETAVWVRPISGAATQFTHVDYVSFDSCRQGWRVGDAAYPKAIVSEISLGGGSTYNTPLAIRAQGYNTYVSARDPQWNVSSKGWFSVAGSSPIEIASSGKGSIKVPTGLPIVEGMEIEFRDASPRKRRQHQVGRVISYHADTGALVYEALGGDGVGKRTSKWTLRPALAAVISEGAYVDVNGGEVGMPGEPGRLVSLRPAPRGDGSVAWGQVGFTAVTSESPGILAEAVNLTGAVPSPLYPGDIRFTGVRGYVSQDEPLIVTSSDFNGRVTLDPATFWSRSQRTSVTAACESSQTQVALPAGGVSASTNFPSDYRAVSGCTLAGSASVAPSGPVGITATKRVGNCTLKITRGLITEVADC